MAHNISETKLGIDFINLYDDDSPLLKIGEIAFFLLTNDVDYHYPIMCSGPIVDLNLTAQMDAYYYVKVEQIYETQSSYDRFVSRKPFKNFVLSGGGSNNKYNVQHNVVSNKYRIADMLHVVHSFFVRNDLEKMSAVKKDYIIHIRRDLEKMILEIDTHNML